MADNDAQYRAQDTEFKHEDTTHMMKIRFIGGNGYPIYPVSSHKFIAKVATADGAYMGDYPCSLVGNQFQVKSADLKGLANGSYKLEVWETYTDDDRNEQTGIFPSPSSFVSFTVNKNIEDTAWDLVKEISFQDLVDKAVIASGQHLVIVATNTLASNLPASVTQEFKDGKNQLTFNIPKGEQGPAGPFPKLEVGTLTKLPNNTEPVVTPTPIDGGYRFDIGIPVGAPGNDGHTPVKGTDYWTSEDQQAIKDDVTKAVGDAYTKAKSDVEDAILNGKW